MGSENLNIYIGKISDISELRHTNSAKPVPVINFTLTVTEPVGRKKIVTKIHCMAFSQDAEFVSQVFSINDDYFIRGKMRQNGHGLKLMVDSIQRFNGRKAS